MSILSATALLLCFTSTSAAGIPDDGFEITESLLQEIVALALPEVKKETGALFPHGVPVRLVGTKEMEEALLDEMRPLMAVQFADTETSEAQAQTAAANFSRALMAKFRLRDHAVLVSEEAFPFLAELIDLPELDTVEALRGVLLHELVHAADEERFAFSKTLQACESAEAQQTFNCIIEGHAQLVAHRIAARLGWQEGFDTYTKAIGSAPREEELEEMGPAMEMFMRVQTATFASAYYQGEAFLRTLQGEGGVAAVERAFRAPPTEMAVIFEPAWFLHPEQRPAAEFRLEVSLDAIAADYPAPKWVNAQVTLTPPQLDISLRLLEPEAIARIKGTMGESRVLNFADQASGGTIMGLVGLIEFRSPADALYYLAAHRRIQHLNDETMREGFVRVLSSSYEDLENPAGIAGLKKVGVGESEIELRTLCLVQGRLVAELVLTEMGVDGEAVRKLALRSLDGALVPVPGPMEGEGGAEGGAEDGKEGGTEQGRAREGDRRAA